MLWRDTAAKRRSSDASTDVLGGGKTSSNSRKPHRKRGKNFIKRNIEVNSFHLAVNYDEYQVGLVVTFWLKLLNLFLQLASDAGEVVAMTAEEKQRIEELLKDIDDEADPSEDNTEVNILIINKRNWKSAK